MNSSTETLRALIDASPNGVILIGVDQRVHIWNRAAEAMFGWTASDVIGRPVPMVPAAREQELAAFHAQVAGGDTLIDIDTQLARRDGTVVDVTLTLAPVRDRTGAVELVLLIASDATARKQAESALRASELRYRGLFSQMQEGVVIHELVCDDAGQPADYVILEANPAFEDITGVRRQTAIGQLASKIYGIEPAPYLDVYAGVVATGEPVIFETTFAPMEKTFEISAFKTGDARFATIFTDLTERRRLEEQFREAQKMEAIGRLAGGVAHDFNNLLTAILGFAELALGELPDDSPARRDVIEIRKAADTAAAVTYQLLAFGRRQMLQPVTLDLNAQVMAKERFLARLIGEDVKVVIRPASEPALVTVDPNQMEQVLLNLAINARDAMPNGGTLTIEVQHVELDSRFQRHRVKYEPGPYVLLSVSDTGEGMTPDVQARLFEPFFTTKERGKGTGLGLATVYGIVKQSDGYVWVYSEVGRGTTFKVYLPATVRPAGFAVDDAAYAPATGTETVLVAENEEAVREFTRKALERRGYRVLAAPGGDEALRLAHEYAGTIDLLLSDVVMPGMNGSTLAAALREQRPLVRVLFMSGYTDDGVVRQGLLDASAAFIQKPFTPRHLLRKVRDVLDAPATAALS